MEWSGLRAEYCNSAVLLKHHSSGRLKEREKRKLKKIQNREGQPDTVDDGQVQIKRRRMNDPEASDIRVAIDCTYDHLMNDLVCPGFLVIGEIFLQLCLAGSDSMHFSSCSFLQL